jgi:hypothetical protein
MLFRLTDLNSSTQILVEQAKPCQLLVRCWTVLILGMKEVRDESKRRFDSSRFPAMPGAEVFCL